MQDLYETSGISLKKSIGVDSSAIYLVDDENDEFYMAYAYNEVNFREESVSRLKKGQGISGRSIETDSVVVLDIDSYPIEDIKEELLAAGVRFLASAPLKTSKGIIGALTVFFRTGDMMEFLDKDFFYYLGEQIGLVLQKAFLYRTISGMANTDSLTGLNNRRKMLELMEGEIQHYNRSCRTFSVGLADLDHFKKVNDSFGHDCGDELLRKEADIFRSVCRSTDSVYRWGGEEFLFLCVYTDKASAILIADRIRVMFEEYRCDCTGEHATTCSIGVTKYEKDMPLEKLVSKADKALYKAKHLGWNRVVSG